MGGIINALNRIVEKLGQIVAQMTKVFVFSVVSENQATTTDGQTIYLGSQAGLIPSTTAGVSKIYIPATCRIKSAKLIWNAGTAGTGESVSCYIRVNNTTDYLIQTLANTSATKEFENTNLGIALTATDYIEIKFVYPTWVTNPANVRIGGILYAEN